MTENMAEKYCVVIPKQPLHHPHDTMAVLLEDDGTLAPLRVFDSIDAAVEAARLHKVDHPDWDYEVRPYYGTNTNILNIEQQGRWKIGVEIVQRV